MLKAGDPVTRFVFFLSSGSDVFEQRNLFEAMVREVDHQFRLRQDSQGPFTLVVDRWEQDAPRRTTEVNEEFVRRAKQAHATVVLLSTSVRDGTREEIAGVLEQQDVQLSVIWMAGPGAGRTGAGRFLHKHKDKIAYHKTGAPGSQESILAMVRVIAAALADITHGDRKEDLFSESR